MGLVPEAEADELEALGERVAVAAAAGVEADAEMGEVPDEFTVRRPQLWRCGKSASFRQSTASQDSQLELPGYSLCMLYMLPRIARCRHESTPARGSPLHCVNE